MMIYKNKHKKLLTLWLSKIILKILNTQQIQKFRTLEKEMTKLTTTQAHRLFNETCINNKVMPSYTNIY